MSADADPLFEDAEPAKDEAELLPGLKDFSRAYEQALQEEQSLANLPAAVKVNPDQYAKAARLAEQLGVSPDVILRRPRQAEEEALLRFYADALTLSPVLRAKATNPDFAALVSDDLKPLLSVEQRARDQYLAKAESRSFWETQLDAFRRGYYDIGKLRAAISGSEVFRLRELEALKKSITENPAAWKPTILVPRRTPEEALRYIEEAQQISRQLIREGLLAAGESVREGAKYPPSLVVQRASAAKSLGEWFDAFMTDPVGYILEIGGQSFVSMAPFYLAAALSRGGIAGTAGAIGTGSLSTNVGAKIVEYLQEKGVDVTDPAQVDAAVQDTALLAEVFDRALAYSGPVAAIDTVSLGVAGKTLVRGSTLFRKTADVAARMGAEAVLGGVSEVAGQLSAGEDLSWGEVMAEAVAEFYASPVDIALMSANKLGRAIDTVQRGAALKRLDEAVQATKLLDRDPQRLAEFLQEALKSGSIDALYVDRRDFEAATEGLPAEGLPDVIREQLADPDNTASIRIPLETYLVDLAKSPVKEALAPYVRTEPDAMNQVEALDFVKNRAELFQQEAEKALAARANAEAMREEAAQVKQYFLGELARRGRFSHDVHDLYASLMRDFYVTMSQRAGMTPLQMLNKYKLRVSDTAKAGPLPSDVGLGQLGARLVESPGFREWFRGSRVVDATGAPLLVYRGTRTPARGFTRDTLYFTSSPEAASNVAEFAPFREGGNVQPAFLAIRNPAEVDLGGALLSTLEGGMDGFLARARAAGHDGAIVRNARDPIAAGTRPGAEIPVADIFVTFSPRQAKSAFEAAELYQAMVDMEAEHPRDSRGRIIGAPPGVGESPEALANLRSTLRQLAREGSAGRYWYENSSRAVLNFVGGDIEAAKRFIALLAIYSPRASVSANTTLALTAYYQWRAGLPIRAGLGLLDKRADALLNRGELWDGLKTNSFYHNLLREIDSSAVEAATIDVWMGRAFGYTRGKVSEAQYAFAARELKRIADELGWNTHQVQAAIWVAIKARAEATAKAVKARALEVGLATKEGDTFKVLDQPAYDALWRQMALEAELDPNRLRGALYDFSHALHERAVQISWEAEPGNTTNILPELRTAPLAQKQEYLTAILKVLAPDGRDAIAEMAGLPAGRTVKGFSAWEGRIGAGAQTFVPVPAVSFEAAERKMAGTVREPARRLLDLYSALRGYILGKDAVAWHKPVYTAAKRDHNGVELVTPRPLTAEEMRVLYGALMDRFGTDALAPAYTMGGARILNFVDGLSNESFQAGVRAVLEALPEGFGGGTAVDLYTYKADGNLITNDWRTQPNGESYRAIIAGFNPELLSRADELRARVAEVNAEFEARYGWGGGGKLYPDSAGERLTIADFPQHGRERARPGSVSVVGIHYSRGERTELSSAAFGAGLRSAESERLADAKDSRLKHRIYFYVAEGQGIQPEHGVGSYAHGAVLHNIYDLRADPLGLQAAYRGDANGLESAILDAGFDGYYIAGMFAPGGGAVLLGPRTVDVRPIKMKYPPFTSAQSERVLLKKRVNEILGSAAPAPFEGAEPTRESGEPPAEGPRLSVLHSLTEEGLAMADKLGGLAMPSLAVVKEGMAGGNFGDITLIGEGPLANPSEVPVFDADAYTPRFPSPEYTVKDAEGLRAFRETIERRASKYGDENGFIAFEFLRQDRPDVPSALRRLFRSPAAKAEFLAARGEEVPATPEEVANRVAPRIPEYKAWVEEALLAHFSRPFLRVKGRRRAFTLSNIVEAMRAAAPDIQGGEKTVTFGVGKARAAVATRISSIDEMRNRARHQIADYPAVEAAQEKTGTALRAWQEAVLPYHTGRDTWGALDASMRALVRWAKGDAFERALRAEGFARVPKPVVEQGLAVARQWLDAPVPYFEAKPQRAVRLTEFAGAVIPHDASPATRAILERHGLAIRTYERGSTKSHADAVNALRNDLAREGRNVLFQPESSQPPQRPARGMLAFDPDDFTSRPAVMSLYAGSDLSTFLHEAGHFFLEVMADLAAQPNAPPDIARDMNIILRWFGVKDLATWRSMTLAEKRPYHEQFARGWEAWLFEGKPPVPEMQSAFSRFRAWLLRVYESLTRLNVTLDPEVRGVFGRMLAAESAIQAAQAEDVNPLFRDAREAGMTEEEWAAYTAAPGEAVEEAVRALERRSLRAMRYLGSARSEVLRRLQAELRTARRAAKADAIEQISNEPTYRALRFLQKGEGAEPGSVHKIGRQHLAEFDPEQVELLEGRRILADEGLHPDIVAHMFGYKSGADLVRDLAYASSFTEAVEARTDRLMLERHGELLDPKEQERRADAAVHNAARVRFVAMELDALAKMAKAQHPGAVYRVSSAVATSAAERIIAAKKIGDLRPSQYDAAARRLAREAEQAFRRGDLVAAASLKRQELVSRQAARIAAQTLERVERARVYLAKFNRESIRKKVDPDYLGQIDALLERFRLRRESPGAVARQQSLAEWIAQQEAQGLTPDIDPRIADTARRQHYSTLTVEEFEGLTDAVRNIEHLGRLKRRLLTAKEARAFDETVTRLADSIAANATHPPAPQRSGERGVLVNISRWWAGFRTEHRKLASLLREMDGFRDGGPLWDTLVRTMNEAGNFEAAETAKAIQRVLDILKPFNDKPRAARRAQHHVPEVNRSFTYEELIGVALNMGNETNRQRVLDGEGWSPAQVEAILKRLTKEDWDMVQSLWDFLDSFRPMIAEKERKITGNEPRWVEPRAVATPFGTYRGGYWPIKYDPLRSTKAEADTAAEVERQMLGGLYARATTRRGHLRERVAKVNRPMRYDFVSVLTQHIDQVIHDVAWHPWLVDANRLINAPAIDAAIRTGYGPEFLREIRQALRDIAVGHLPAQTQFDRAVAHVRTGATIAVMGWRFSTALVQPLGLTQSMVRVGPKWIARGLAQWFAGPKSMTETVDWIKSRSDFMRTRADTLQREIAEIHARVRGERRSPLVDLAFLPMQKMQLLADVPTWLGAYHKAMAEPNMTESRAIALADQAVIDSQGSGRIADLARVQRGSEGMKLFTNFYSFFNTTYNLAAERTRAARLKSPADVAALASDYLLLFVAPALLSALLRDALGKAPEGEDWDELLKRYAKELGGYVLGTMLGLREIGSVLGGFDYRGPAGLRVFADLGNLYKQIEQGEIDAALVKSLLSTGGVLFHAPTGQLVTTIDGIVALSEGRTDNPAALLVGGPPRH